MSESELQEFLATIPEDILDQLAAEIDGAVSSAAVSDYASTRSARNAEIINAKTAASQEIGPLPEVQNPERRERCSASNILFAETYFQPTFYLPWAPYQRSMMDRFQHVVFRGGREVHAVRRGGLKSTCARVSTIWAVVNGHRKFPVLVGATDDKANEHRKNFFDLLASSELLLADYPELRPLLLKWRQPKKQFRLGGRLLELHPKDDRGHIIFPDIHDAPSCQAHVAPYSVSATDVSGLSYVNRNGVTVRPDLIVFDDVQTPQSSRSPMMTEERENAVTKTFLGLAGLGEKIAAIMVCTVREHEDLTERFLDRKRHPDWHGKKYPSVLRFPDRMDLWDANAARLGMGATPEDGAKLSIEHYLTNRPEMDAGGKVAWEHDKLPHEPSSLYSLMTVRAIDPAFFRCEIQQEGVVLANTSGVQLHAQTLLTKCSHIERGTVPEKASYTVGFVDSSDQVLWWMVCSFSADFSGWIVDYGTWPDQERPIFYKSDLWHTISEELPGASWEEAFTNAHNNVDQLLFRRFPNLDLLLKDWSDGGQKPRIESQILHSQFKARLRPSKGFAPKPGRKPVHLWGDAQRDRQRGLGWIERRTDNPVHVQFNTNEWKSFAARRLLTTSGAPSSVSLPGSDERANKLLSEHLTAESPKTIVYDSTPGIIWELLPGRNNDWWDCFVGCCVAASIAGSSLPGETEAARPKKVFALPKGTRHGK